MFKKINKRKASNIFSINSLLNYSIFDEKIEIKFDIEMLFLIIINSILIKQNHKTLLYTKLH